VRFTQYLKVEDIPEKPPVGQDVTPQSLEHRERPVDAGKGETGQVQPPEEATTLHPVTDRSGRHDRLAAASEPIRMLALELLDSSKEAAASSGCLVWHLPLQWRLQSASTDYEVLLSVPEPESSTSWSKLIHSHKRASRREATAEADAEHSGGCPLLDISPQAVHAARASSSASSRASTSLSSLAVRGQPYGCWPRGFHVLGDHDPLMSSCSTR